MGLEGKNLKNRYELIEKIGNGGMATVYKAKDTVLKRNVAVKILRDEFKTDAEFIKRFEIEAQAAASIAHPNIVSVYDVGNDGGLYYIVMELIQGKTLKEIIVNEKGGLPWKWSINIAIQIASALEIAHKNNIIHRDIKPHNIIITEDGVAKVTDFGIAKAVSNSTITSFGTTIGSVHYFSPEHAHGGYTDAKSDLYSLGVVMYEMLTGRVPFDADTPVSVALKHMQEQAVPPKVVNPNIPIAVNDIIMKALRKDANERYASATQMLDDLRRALKEPNGDFVDNNNNFESPTQRISTSEIKMESKISGRSQSRVSKKTNVNSKNKPNKFIEFVKKHKILTWAVALVVLFALSLFGTLSYFKATEPKDVQIPELIGKTAEEAEQILSNSGFKFEYLDDVYSTEYEAGVIVKQDPTYKANYSIKEGSSFKLTKSKGTEKTTMPKVAGMTKEEALYTIKQSKLVAEVVEETSKEIKEGYITKQEVPENTELNAGDTVKIFVSIGTGLKQIVVPSVKTKPIEEAKKILTDLGLKVDIEYDEDTTKDGNSVLNQNVVSGSVVDEGTTVVLTVNKIAEIKYGTVKINLKSLSGYKEKVDDDGKTDTPPNVSLKVTVDSEGKTETAYDKSIPQDTTDISVKISGKGTVTVKVYINNALEGREYSLDLNKETTLTLE